MAVDDTIEREKRRGEKGTRERKGAEGKNLENAFFFFFFSAKEEPFRKLEKNYSLLQEETYYYHSVQE